MKEQNEEIIDYKGKSFRCNFEIMDIPQLQEVKNLTNGGYYMTSRKNRSGIADTWFNQLLELYYTSPLHGAIINKLHRKINDGVNDPFFKEYSLDALIFGGAAIEITWNYFHTKIVQMKILPFEKVRAGLIDKETHDIEYYMFSNDWFKTSYRKWYKMDKFSTDTKSQPHQIYYFKQGRSGDIYPKPYYSCALKYIYVQNELATYFANLIKNNFTANGILHLPNPQSEEQSKLEENLFVKENSGSNGVGVIVTHGRQDEAPTFVKFNNDADDGKYMFLPDYTDMQIVMGHNVPVQIILQTPGNLGGSTEYEFFTEQYNKDIVQTMKTELWDSYMSIKSLM